MAEQCLLFSFKIAWHRKILIIAGASTFHGDTQSSVLVGLIFPQFEYLSTLQMREISCRSP